jgi:hypothetical protein
VRVGVRGAGSGVHHTTLRVATAHYPTYRMRSDLSLQYMHDRDRTPGAYRPCIYMQTAPVCTLAGLGPSAYLGTCRLVYFKNVRDRRHYRIVAGRSRAALADLGELQEGREGFGNGYVMGLCAGGLSGKSRVEASCLVQFRMTGEVRRLLTGRRIGAIL